MLRDAGLAGELGALHPMIRFPGLPAALASTLGDLRLSGVAPGAVSSAPEIAGLYQRYATILGASGLADRAAVLAAGTAALARDPKPVPTLLLDVPIDTSRERDFALALVRNASSILVTQPHGDDPLDGRSRPAPAPAPKSGSLATLREHLFAADPPPASPLDASLRFLSAPGEARECVEIARCLLAEARRGVPFERMAVLLRHPETYAPHLESALARAGIRAYVAHGSLRPDPAGRALLALVACASEGITAHGFLEYLSLGQVPSPEDPAPGSGFTPPADLASHDVPEDDDAPEDDAVPDAVLPSPRRWRRHVIDAKVIAGRDRFQRRLLGYQSELEQRLHERRRTDPGSPAIAVMERDVASVAALRRFATPLIDALAALPARAPWATWTHALGRIARLALRRPARVLALLAELDPLADVADVTIDDVVTVLSAPLASLRAAPPRDRSGRVFVAPIGDARGMAFDVVFVPGLGERQFPRPIVEDPLLPDAARRAIHGALPDRERRAHRERMLLAIAAGAARERMVLSYSRIDSAQARSRVPSFYLLEALRAATGRIHDFAAFEHEVALATGARLSWPAPVEPGDAIDEAEHDLAILDPLLRALSRGTVRGRARYLLELNEHLARSLRARAVRWERRWRRADGMCHLGRGARERLEDHRLKTRAHSISGLERYAACPYQFYLAALLGIPPADDHGPVEALDPLTRGRIFHRAQAEALRELEGRSMLPLDQERLPAAIAILDTALDRVAAASYEELAPSIRRVWNEEIDAMRADLRTWIAALAPEPEGFVPYRFELGFGFPPSGDRDPRSTPDPASVFDGYLLHGIMDLVERHPATGGLRVTDHKTGSAGDAKEWLKVGGGRVLQPALYALALEAIGDGPVVSGRLSFCTAAAGFAVREVALDRDTRNLALGVLRTIDAAISSGFLPPAPAPEACGACDYRMACGPLEERRLREKERRPLEPLEKLRRLR
ncbi:MAG: PD-(D/E)XK nuclease family protein [Acidobacteriota bacterium]